LSSFFSNISFIEALASANPEDSHSLSFFSARSITEFIALSTSKGVFLVP